MLLRNHNHKIVNEEAVVYVSDHTRRLPMLFKIIGILAMHWIAVLLHRIQRALPYFADREQRVFRAGLGRNPFLF